MMCGQVCRLLCDYSDQIFYKRHNIVSVAEMYIIICTGLQPLNVHAHKHTSQHSSSLVSKHDCWRNKNYIPVL